MDTDHIKKMRACLDFALVEDLPDDARREILAVFDECLASRTKLARLAAAEECVEAARTIAADGYGMAIGDHERLVAALAAYDVAKGGGQ